VPFGPAMRADMGQARGAQSGEVDRHRVWLAARNLEPKMSPFDSWAIFDEIQRLVPGYQVSRLELMGGNDQHTSCEVAGTGSAAHPPELIVPAHDTLFTSGTLGQYSAALHAVIEGRQEKPKDLVVIEKN
jgi:NADH-quinone oxidoreductase subunit G